MKIKNENLNFLVDVQINFSQYTPVIGTLEKTNSQEYTARYQYEGLNGITLFSYN